ncbi:MAG: 16S rRNA (guanine(527)-N(7))-methyltransferase RsmG [Acidobacteriota bacterium]|jgi:16S rRNA (guanine527-N7)-methyltransferase
MSFVEELERALPADLPHRARVIEKAGQHLELIVVANEHLNLTRITSPREAAVKHVLDAVLPWRLFAGAKTVVDAGSGPGFPGVPLSLVLPEVRFVLAESVQKKARFLEAAVEQMELANVRVLPQRAEDVLRAIRADTVTARAVAPLSRAVGLFAPAVKAGTRALFYKGPDVETEIEQAATETRKNRMFLRVVDRYELPDGFGTRTVVEMTRYGRLEDRNDSARSD